MTRREFLAALAAAAGTPAAVAHAVPSLKDTCRNKFLIGTALDFRTGNDFNATELDLIRSQFNVITPENSMKPGPVHRQESSWNWTRPEALVTFCQQNNITALKAIIDVVT